MAIADEKYISLVESISELSDHDLALLVAEQLVTRSWIPHVAVTAADLAAGGSIDVTRIEELIEQIRFYMLDFYGTETKS